MADIAKTAPRSSRDSTTASDSSGVSCCACRRCVQTMNSWIPMIPITIISVAGESPAIVNGALGPATSNPHRLRLLNPKLIKMIAVAASATPTRSILVPAIGGIGFSLPLMNSTAPVKGMTMPNA